MNEVVKYLICSRLLAANLPGNWHFLLSVHLPGDFAEWVRCCLFFALHRALNEWLGSNLSCFAQLYGLDLLRLAMEDA